MELKCRKTTLNESLNVTLISLRSRGGAQREMGPKHYGGGCEYVSTVGEKDLETQHLNPCFLHWLI